MVHKTLKKAEPNKQFIIVLDNAGSHVAYNTLESLEKVEGLNMLQLSPYSPELNPIELFFGDLKKSLKNIDF